MTKKKLKKRLKRTDGHDSDEELYFSHYLDELKEAGIVLSWRRHPTLELSSNVLIGKRVLLRAQVYTPDFEVVWNREHPGLSKLFRTLASYGDKKPEVTPFIGSFLGGEKDQFVSAIEVKGSYTEPDEIRMYGILKKWSWSAFQVFINTIIVSNQSGIFEKTFTPMEFLLTKSTRKPRKLHYEPRSLSEFLAQSPM